MWQHDCPEEGEIEVGDNDPCSWCCGRFKYLFNCTGAERQGFQGIKPCLKK